MTMRPAPSSSAARTISAAGSPCAITSSTSSPSNSGLFEKAGSSRPAAVRRDDDEAGPQLLGRAHDLGGRLAVRDHVLDFEPLELRALREGGELAPRRRATR